MITLTSDEKRLLREVVLFKADKCREVKLKILGGVIREYNMSGLRVPTVQECQDEIDLCNQVMQKLE